MSELVDTLPASCPATYLPTYLPAHLLTPGVLVVSAHPGWAVTEGVKGAIPGFYNFYKDKFRDLDQGADTFVWLALQVHGHGGCLGGWRQVACTCVRRAGVARGACDGLRLHARGRGHVGSQADKRTAGCWL